MDTIMLPARNTDPETSHQGFTTTAKLREQYQNILAVVGGEKLTDPKILRAYRLRFGSKSISPSGCRTRRKELVDMGLIRDSGLRGERRNRELIRWERA